MERIICKRLEAFLGEEGLSDHQFGFRKGRSTINSKEMAMATTKDAIIGKRWLGVLRDHYIVR